MLGRGQNIANASPPIVMFRGDSLLTPFTRDSEWNEGGNWSLDTTLERAEVDTFFGTQDLDHNVADLEAGAKYRLQIYLEDGFTLSSPYIQIDLGDAAGTGQATLNTAGYNYFILTAGAANTTLNIRAQDNSVANIKHVALFKQF